jgi:hypothetical protein
MRKINQMPFSGLQYLNNNKSVNVQQTNKIKGSIKNKKILFKIK